MAGYNSYLYTNQIWGGSGSTNNASATFTSTGSTVQYMGGVPSGFNTFGLPFGQGAGGTRTYGPYGQDLSTNVKIDVAPGNANAGTFGSASTSAALAHRSGTGTPAQSSGYPPGSTYGLQSNNNKATSQTSSAYDAALISAATANIYNTQKQATGASSALSFREPPKNIYQKEREHWATVKEQKRFQKYGQDGSVKTYSNLALTDPSRYYCDLCKVSCAGNQTYKEHLEGSRHKKREAETRAALAAKAAGQQVPGANAAAMGRYPPASYRCELCESPCSGLDTFLAHLKGQKHIKTLKLYQRLNKPLPLGLQTLMQEGLQQAAARAAHTDPKKLADELGLSLEALALLASGRASSRDEAQRITSGTSAHAPASLSTTGMSYPSFVSGATLKTIVDEKGNSRTIEVKPSTQENAAQAANLGTSKDPNPTQIAALATANPTPIEPMVELAKVLDLNQTAPVGLEYIEAVLSEGGKANGYHCRLCECSFTDVAAKDMHAKGRRHRLNYKRKVDPNLIVDEKPQMYRNKAGKLVPVRTTSSLGKRRYNPGPMPWQWSDVEERVRLNENYERVNWMARRLPTPLMSLQFAAQAAAAAAAAGEGTLPESLDDRHVLVKDSQITPRDTDELPTLEKLVMHCEKALKMVSDEYLTQAEPEAPKAQTESNPSTISTAPADGAATCAAASESASVPAAAVKGSNRVFRGVMRVGALANGLVIRSDLNVQLVLLTTKKPTRPMLEFVYQQLTNKMKLVSQEPEEAEMADTPGPVNENSGSANAEDTGAKAAASTTASDDMKTSVPLVPSSEYSVHLLLQEAAVLVRRASEPLASCLITLACPALRADERAPGSKPQSGETEEPDPPNMLPKQKMLDALANLRHAKWFQAKAVNLYPCVVVMRVLRDLCQRINTWSTLSDWMQIQLVHKCVETSIKAGVPLGPGAALRRVMECISSGWLLPVARCGGPGVADPCEREPVDVFRTLTVQEAEDVTASAQHALRLIAFRQIYKVLSMSQIDVDTPKATIGGSSDKVEDVDGEEEEDEDMEDPQPAPAKTSK